MTDAISNTSRLGQIDSPSRKLSEKGAKPDAVVSATGSESEIAARKADAAQDSASVGFLEVQQRLKQEPEFDRAKVDAIKQAIQNGQYPLNPRRIAESFVALEQLISD
ncbi:MAG: flagellar biosynthesis anti-sigma factor FlgM [Burkholderiaceae bacterium]